MGPCPPSQPYICRRGPPLRFVPFVFHFSGYPFTSSRICDRYTRRHRARTIFRAQQRQRTHRTIVAPSSSVHCPPSSPASNLPPPFRSNQSSRRNPSPRPPFIGKTTAPRCPPEKPKTPAPTAPGVPAALPHRPAQNRSARFALPDKPRRRPLRGICSRGVEVAPARRPFAPPHLRSVLPEIKPPPRPRPPVPNQTAPFDSPLPKPRRRPLRSICSPGWRSLRRAATLRRPTVAPLC